MANHTLKFEDFREEKLSKKEQKTIHGGDGSCDPNDTNRGNGKGSMQPINI